MTYAANDRGHADHSDITESQVEANPAVYPPGEKRPRYLEYYEHEPTDSARDRLRDQMHRDYVNEDRRDQQFHEIIGALRAPPSAIKTFDGNPLRYYAFIKAFEHNVERTIADGSARLARLIDLCVGEAASALEDHQLAYGEEGYRRARMTLQRKFGDPFVISHAWIQKLVHGPPSTSLKALATDLKNCKETLSALGALKEINVQHNLVHIVKTLPAYLQARWKQMASHLRTRGDPPRMADISDLVDFVDDAAEVDGDPIYGDLLKPAKGRQATAPGTQKPASSDSRYQSRRQQATSYGTQADSSCIHCEASHPVWKCEEFLRLNPEQRVKALLPKRACFICLRPGHQARECRTEHKECRKKGCKKHHNSLLHGYEFKKLRAASQEATSAPSDTPAPRTGESGSSAHAEAYTYYTLGNKVALPTVAVRVINPTTRKVVETSALLDTGSTHTFCSTELLDRLGIQGKPSNLNLFTMEKANSTYQSHVARLLVSNVNGGPELEIPLAYTSKGKGKSIGALDTALS